MISRCTKFEVFWFTRYDAMNGGAKCRAAGSVMLRLEVLGSVQNFVNDYCEIRCYRVI